MSLNYGNVRDACGIVSGTRGAVRGKVEVEGEYLVVQQWPKQKILFRSDNEEEAMRARDDYRTRLHHPSLVRIEIYWRANK